MTRLTETNTTETKPSLLNRVFAKASLRRLTRGLIAPLLVGALTLTSITAPPAFAGPRNQNNNDEINGLIAALLGLAVVGAVISNKNNDHDSGRPTKPRRPKRGGQGWDDRGMHPKFQLPRDCLRRFNTQYGKEKYWGKRCLKRNYEFSRSLPRSCRDTIVARNNRGVYVVRKVYEPRCMKQAGYRKSRR